MRRAWAMVLLMAAGCGGIRAGSEAVVVAPPHVFKEDSESGRSHVVAVIPGFHREDGHRRLDRARDYYAASKREAVALEDGTAVRVLEVKDDRARVEVRSGEHAGLALWVALDRLKVK